MNITNCTMAIASSVISPSFAVIQYLMKTLRFWCATPKLTKKKRKWELLWVIGAGSDARGQAIFKTFIRLQLQHKMAKQTMHEMDEYIKVEQHKGPRQWQEMAAWATFENEQKISREIKPNENGNNLNVCIILFNNNTSSVFAFKFSVRKQQNLLENERNCFLIVSFQFSSMEFQLISILIVRFDKHKLPFGFFVPFSFCSANYKFKFI